MNLLSSLQFWWRVYSEIFAETGAKGGDRRWRRAGSLPGRPSEGPRCLAAAITLHEALRRGAREVPIVNI